MTAILILIVILFALPAQGAMPEAAPKEITITARQYGYEPHRILLDAGETVRLHLVSVDTVHGLYLEGHDLDARIFPGKLDFEVRHPSKGDAYQTVENVLLTFDRPGKYRYRCSITCGPLHPFMQGELVVRPNVPFRAGALAASVLGFGLLGWMMVPRGAAASPRRRLDLFAAFPWLRWILIRRSFQFLLVLPNLLILVFFIAAGLLGTPIGNRNIIVTIVWIFWWFLLITILVPLGGRVWCLLCPLPSIGEWLARRRFIGVRHSIDSTRPSGEEKKRRWPVRLSGLWIQNIAFLALCTFSTILVTRPALTAVVLGIMMFAAIAVHAAFDRRTFCRYLCPLNSWMSIYSMAAVTELRPRDAELCQACRKRSCVRGTEEAWRCPWLEIPFQLDRNNYCGLCMECVKACPNGNMTLLARPFCSDRSIRQLDEAWMAFIMIALVISYTVTLLGPWATIRDWANVTEVGNWGGFLLHGALVWFAALVLIPAIWFAAASAGARLSGSDRLNTREIFVRCSFMLVPLGLMAWIAFSIPLLMINHTHITSSLSDPLGWGWDLFGTANQRWSPLLPEVIPYLQTPILLAGLAAAIWSGGKVVRELGGDAAVAARTLAPHAVVCVAITLLLLRLFTG